MQTDKELYHIFRACPEMIFLLAHLPAPRGGCKFSSIAVKAVQRTMDGLLTPEDPHEPLTITEIQFQRSADIYPRIIVEMAQIQQQHDMRLVQGIICFAEASLDPATEPWKSSGLVRCVYLKEELQNIERQTPDHPLVAIFKPIFEPSELALEKEAVVHYRHLQHSELSSKQREALCDIFVILLTQRLRHRTTKQIAMILELPDIRDTVCGQELIAEGEAKGRVEGKAEGRAEGEAKGRAEGEAKGRVEGKAEGEVQQLRDKLRVFATRKFGPLPLEVSAGIQKLDLPQGDELFDCLFDMSEIGDLKRWLSEHRS